MSDAMVVEGPRKRNFAAPPDVNGTRLFERPGPVLVVCVHRELGFYVGEAAGRAVWSHDPAAAAFRGASHPDAFRTSSAWPDEATARGDLARVLSRREAGRVSYGTVRADVAQAPDTVGLTMAESMPTPMCSIEACSAATGLHRPDARHALDPSMRRLVRPRMARVSLAGSAGSWSARAG